MSKRVKWYGEGDRGEGAGSEDGVQKVEVPEVQELVVVWWAGCV